MTQIRPSLEPAQRRLLKVLDVGVLKTTKRASTRKLDSILSGHGLGKTDSKAIAAFLAEADVDSLTNFVNSDSAENNHLSKGFAFMKLPVSKKNAVLVVTEDKDGIDQTSKELFIVNKGLEILKATPRVLGLAPAEYRRLGIDVVSIWYE